MVVGPQLSACRLIVIIERMRSYFGSFAHFYDELANGN